MLFASELAYYLNMQTRLKTLFSLLLLLEFVLTPAMAQEQVEYPSLLGSWEGSFVAGRDDMILAFTFVTKDGQYSATMTSSSLGIYGMPVEIIELENLRVDIRAPRLDIEFNGSLRLDEAGEKIIRIDGNWFRHSEMVPVVLKSVEAPSF